MALHAQSRPTLCNPVNCIFRQEFSRQEYWNGLPFPIPGDLPDPGINCIFGVSCIGRQILYQQHHLGTSALRHHLMQMLPPLHFCKTGHGFKGDQRVPGPDVLTSLLGAGAQICSVALGDRFLPLLNSLLIQLHPKAQPCQYQHGPPLTQSCPQLGLPGLTQSCFRLRTAREPRTFCAEWTEAPHPQG